MADEIKMPPYYHRLYAYMRTTLTLDDDVAAKLKRLARRSGRAFCEVVNVTLRRGLLTDARQRASSIEIPG